MTHARGDQYRHARFHRNPHTVEFQCRVGSTFENHIRFGLLFVIMDAGIIQNLDTMDTQRRTRNVGEGPLRPAAGAADRWQASQVNNSGRRHGGGPMDKGAKLHHPVVGPGPAATSEEFFVLQGCGFVNGGWVEGGVDQT